LGLAIGGGSMDTDAVRRFARMLLLAIAYLLATIGAWIAIVFAWGLFVVVLHPDDTECDRGECSPLGEFTDDHRALLTITALVIALALVSMVFATLRRRFRDRDRAPRLSNGGATST
jgi:hypothetical protein